MKPSAFRVLIGAAVALGLAALQAGGAEPAPPGAPADAAAFPLSAYAAIGSSVEQSGHFAELGWNDAQLAAFIDGLRAAFHGKGYPMDDASLRLTAEMSRQIGEIVARAQQQAAAGPEQKKQFEKYFKEMRRTLGMQVSDSGLGYSVEPGRNGIRPRPGDTIVITCEARAAGTSTPLQQLSAPNLRVKLDGMLPGLMEGIQMMSVGSRGVFALPPALSFGNGQWPEGVESGTLLVYSITLHDVISAGAKP
jgi:FKBP-type peptidyl-prolyl cis-trans isomerase FkpA